MVSKILTPQDTLIVPKYVHLFNKVIDEISPFYTSKTIQEAKVLYTQEYIVNHLNSPSEIRFIGHFSDQNLDGLLIERFDKLDGNRTTINWVLAGEKGLGIGSELILDCISRAKNENKDNVTLVVAVENTLARKLYRKLGFISGGVYTSKNKDSLELMGYVF
ncbi:hypothetical protein COV13_03655 [Candidatus Woesearchaeota archaeon CG10_big_fil_rev_8_21_14_0_10_32_9]|nr:MAG: hypothetical protein COV13_03655 [Candidatus Woesearchaeota archaeon CG10_big_fil_rev_8_21_14_0_10_32_9]